MVAAIVLLGSLGLGWLLSLIIGLSYEAFFWISPVITTINSLALGTAILVSLYLARFLVVRSSNLFVLLVLSFGIVSGGGIISFSGFFLYQPATFLYSDNRTVAFLLISLLFFVTINIISSGFVFFQQTVVEKEQALVEEQFLKKQMELKFLAAKINPHFLFNSLNLLVSLLKTPEKAEETLINLSELLRYQLDISEEKTVSLESELNVVQKYLSIQKLRFGDKLSFEITCSVKGDIPPLIIQPLVENSIKHNIEQTQKLDIEVIITEKNKTLTIEVKDSMSALKDSMLEKGVGLSVTRKRVEHFGGTFSIVNGGIEISFKND